MNLCQGATLYAWANNAVAGEGLHRFCVACLALSARLSAKACRALALPSVDTTLRAWRRAASMHSGFAPQPSSRTRFPAECSPPQVGSRDSKTSRLVLSLYSSKQQLAPALKWCQTVASSRCGPFQGCQAHGRCVA